MNKVRALVTLILMVTFSLTLAQLQNEASVLMLKGEVALWNLGAASIETATGIAPLSPEGTFTLILETPDALDLEPVQEYDGINCLTSSNPESRYLTIFYLEVYQENDFIADLYLETPGFDWNLGEAVKEFHYYSEDTVVSGSCVIEYEDGFIDTYEFPSLAMKQGWNELTAVVTERADLATTLTLSLNNNEAIFQWAFDPWLDERETCGGIRHSLNYAE